MCKINGKEQLVGLAKDRKEASGHIGAVDITLYILKDHEVPNQQKNKSNKANSSRLSKSFIFLSHLLYKSTYFIVMEYF